METGVLFARYTGLGECGQTLYNRLVEEFAMDGAQEVCIRLVELAAGELDHGSIMLTEREFEGLRFTRDEFGAHLPDALARALDDLVTVLAKAGPPRV